MAKQLEDWVLTTAGVSTHSCWEQETYNRFQKKGNGELVGTRGSASQHIPDLLDCTGDELKRRVDLYEQYVLYFAQMHLCWVKSCGKGRSGRRGCRFCMYHASIGFIWPNNSVVDLRVTSCYQLRYWTDAMGDFQWQLTAILDSPPTPSADEPFPVDDRILLWIHKRPQRGDMRLTDTNRTLAVVAGCNTNVQFLSGSTNYVVCHRYQVGYCTKNPNPLDACLTTLRSVFGMERSTRDNKVRNPKQLLGRIITQWDKTVQYSAQVRCHEHCGSRRSRDAVANPCARAPCAARS